MGRFKILDIKLRHWPYLLYAICKFLEENIQPRLGTEKHTRTPIISEHGWSLRGDHRETDTI